MYQLFAFDYRLLLHRRRKNTEDKARAVIETEREKRSAVYRVAWQEAFDAAEDEERDRTRDNAKNAREHKSQLRLAKLAWEVENEEE
eukprot:CAMPEP_0198227822 /NCGR_PEP_ID=MMETSP1445-20131203/110763_1 /TAXON_ID=36898 /ORGANISM="Pyramimonas sp., Strain CCMP2087" /LENGTH=86 /DNA_ID=CAMNT_0043907999 /DNA_START=12 /DNA_END=269 /DNA_ORIENTATION=+